MMITMKRYYQLYIGLLLSLFLLPLSVLASYEAYTYYGDGTDRPSATAGGTVGIQYVATSTHYNINQVQIRAYGTGSGYVAFLNVYLRNLFTDQFTPIASSSVTVQTSFSTTTFTLDRSLQLAQGGAYMFEIVPDPALGTSTNRIFVSASPKVGSDPTTLYIAPYGTTTGLTTTYGSYAGGSNYMSAPLILISSNNVAPNLPLDDIVNKTCESLLDIFCQLSKAIAWAFYPSQSVISIVSNISFASSSPFSYFYDLSDYAQTLKNGSSSDPSLSVNIGALSTSFSLSQIASSTGHANEVRSYIGYFVWFIALFGAIAQIKYIWNNNNNDN